MRILLLARLDQAEEYFRGTKPATTPVPELPPAQSQHFWVKALRKQGHDVEVVRYTDPIFPSPKLSFQLSNRLRDVTTLGHKAIQELRRFVPPSLDPEYKRRNESILEQVVEFNPELLIVIGGYHQLSDNTFETIERQCSPTTVGVSGTGPHDYGTKEERYIAPRYYNVMFVNDRHRMHAWRGIGANAEILPLAASPIKFASGNRTYVPEYEADVSFVGQPYPRRVQYLKSLTEFDLAIYGPGWEDTVLADYHRGEAWGEELFKAIYSSDISINVHHRAMLSGGNMRLFEIPAAKTLQIADACEDEWFIDGEEIILVDTPEKLRESVAYYLDASDEREQIAEAGYERAVAEHTYYDRMQSLVERVLNNGGRADEVVKREYLEDDGLNLF